MTPITAERVMELARKYQEYPGAREVTLRGFGVVEFAQALLAEAYAAHVADVVDSEGGEI